MNCQRDKSDKGSRELYTSGLSNYSSTERAKGKNRTPLSDVGGDRTFGNYGRLLGCGLAWDEMGGDDTQGSHNWPWRAGVPGIIRPVSDRTTL
jgi:hypothetical protein